MPIPLTRMYNAHMGTLTNDCFDVLRYAVRLLLDTASHLSSVERERLKTRMDRNAAFTFVHPASALLLGGNTREFANFAIDCILSEHNSTSPLLLTPRWPSVSFDKQGRPTFPQDEDPFFTAGPPEPIHQKEHHHKGHGERSHALPPNLIAIPAKRFPGATSEENVILTEGRRNANIQSTVNKVPPWKPSKPSKDNFELPRL